MTTSTAICSYPAGQTAAYYRQTAASHGGVAVRAIGAAVRLCRGLSQSVQAAKAREHARIAARVAKQALAAQTAEECGLVSVEGLWG